MERDEKGVIILLEKKILKAVLYTGVRKKSGQVRGELESKIIISNSFKPEWFSCLELSFDFLHTNTVSLTSSERC